jgi:hypothetical protein
LPAETKAGALVNAGERQELIAQIVASAENELRALVKSRPKSRHWHKGKLDSQLAALSVAGIDGVTQAVGGVQFPTELSIEAKLGEAVTTPLDRSAGALEDIVSFVLRGQSGECGVLATISDGAFLIVAKLTTLTAYLMDREQASDESIANLIEKYDGLIREIAALLESAGLKAALPTLAQVTDLKSLRGLKGEAFNAEMNHRAALLLGLKCLVATRVRDGTDPKRQPPEDPPQDPVGKKAGRK